jgi:hypothetical protein
VSIHNKVGADVVLISIKTIDYGLCLVAGQALFGRLSAIADSKKMVELVKQNTILASNNTPPASRKISAPRGVTCFWGTEK